MKDCWKVRPSDRPSFAQLRKSFDLILSSNKRESQFYLEMSPPRGNSVSTASYLEILPNQHRETTLTRSNLYVKVV